MMLRKLMIYILVVLIFAGCKQKLPDPEADKAKALETNVVSSKEMTIRHSLQGNSLFIECFIPGISFSDAKPGGQSGKALLYMDGQLYNEYETAAFVVKDIPSGFHTFKIEIVGKDNRSLGISKKFTATVG
ncbi:MAG TPA: hypothetical protein DEO65_10680 [Bacillus bacterium]|uniref:Lipoprotein n=1 Tax=Siminovitchia fordii TaxID=254759 RepID=A0ABQ4JZU6_9BACI|nr:hypothetical protein [Siminovitchia fordii]GIN19058.1 hypothetical protein J1TS3_01920 [Siminovitchia fordii]HBZ10327.1 hypothetical protein [Bacillus sp. (in: firmicutes)]